MQAECKRHVRKCPAVHLINLSPFHCDIAHRVRFFLQQPRQILTHAHCQVAHHGSNNRRHHPRGNHGAPASRPRRSHRHVWYVGTIKEPYSLGPFPQSLASLSFAGHVRMLIHTRRLRASIHMSHRLPPIPRSQLSQTTPIDQRCAQRGDCCYSCVDGKVPNTGRVGEG